MKTLKNDTRYIIKRVLIGVLIAIVLFNARKCGVYADTTDITVLSTNSTGSLTIGTNVSTSGYTKMCTAKLNGYNFNIYYYDTGASGSGFNNCYAFLFNNPNNTDEYKLMFVLYDYGRYEFSAITDNSYIDFDAYMSYSPNNTRGTILVPPNYVIKDVNTNLVPSNQIVINTTGYTYGTQYGYTSTFSISTVLNGTTIYPSTVNPALSSNKASVYNVYTTWDLYSNSDIPIKIGGSYRYEPTPQFPPTGYSELSLKDYQGVVFVPKNYNNIECSVVGDLCNTTFDYYYQEEIKEAYFPLDNRFNIRFNSDFLNSPNEPSELKSTYFPISQVSVNETFYYAFMIYNYTNDGSPLDPNNYYAYGDAKVWYDSTNWNYYLVEDFNEWSANVCYFLDGNEVCTTISGLPTLKDAIEQAQLEDNILGTHVGDLNLFTSIIRFPLGFVQSLSSESCTAIQLPPLPFIGGNISLPCMSLIYQQVLGIYQPVISGFINFIIIYYLIVALIKFYNKTFDPSHTEIEVIDL